MSKVGAPVDSRPRKRGEGNQAPRESIMERRADDDG